MKVVISILTICFNSDMFPTLHMLRKVAIKELLESQKLIEASQRIKCHRIFLGGRGGRRGHQKINALVLSGGVAL